MSVDLRWNGYEFMLGTLVIARLVPAELNDGGALAYYQLAGQNIVTVTALKLETPVKEFSRLAEITTERARNYCETAARRALRGAGVEVEP